MFGQSGAEKGDLRDGLYRLNTKETSTSSAASLVENNLESADYFVVNFVLNLDSFVNVVVSKEVWHRRLRHPSLKLVDSIIKKCNLLVVVNDSWHFCEACKYGTSHALPFPNSNS